MNEEREYCREMMRGCSCGWMLRKRRGALYAALIGGGLLLLVIQAGWLLGVVAFFRTL